MAIDLPPVLPPQLATQSQIEASAYRDQQQTVHADIAGITIRVLGNQWLSVSQLRDILSNADSPSSAITELTRQYYNAGYLLVGVRYFRVGDTVTVLVTQNTLAGVRGEPAIASHFQGLVGDRDLRLEEFDRARVLADWQSQRAGLDYRVSFEQHHDDQVIMELNPQAAEGYRQTAFGVGVDNRGSRFLGRYFADGELEQRFADGSELQAEYRTALTDLGEAEQGDDYHQLNLRYQRASRFGLYGISLSHLQYRRELEVSEPAEQTLLCTLLGVNCSTASAQGVELDAEVDRLGVSGEQVWRSNPVRRLSFFQQLEYIESSIEAEQSAEPLLDERYANVTLGGRYAWRGRHLGQSANLRAELGASAGFDVGDGSFESDSSTSVGIGRRSANYFTLSPSIAYRLDWPGQWHSVAAMVAQLSNDTQLPQQHQWVLGGFGGLSAWLPGALLGDSGYLANVGLQREWQRWGINFSGAIFAEYGAAWFEDTTSALGDKQSASDAGLRLTAAGGGGVSSDFIIATPLSDSVADTERLDNLRSDFFWRLTLSF